jgi:integrase
VQEFVDALDVNASTIESTVLPLRLAYRYARGRGTVAADPTDGQELPEKGRGRRLPPSPADAAVLLAHASEQDRAVWATAMLAGLRRGELMALRVTDVDLKAGRLRVERVLRPGGAGVPAAREPAGTPARTDLIDARAVPTPARARPSRRAAVGASAERPFTAGRFRSARTPDGKPPASSA